MGMPSDPVKYAEVIKKLSLSHMGKPSGRKGKKASKELRLKLSIAHKGKTHSGTFKKGHVFHPFQKHGMKDKHHTAETRRRMSITRKGMVFTPQWIENLAKVKRGPFKDTKPERMMQIALTLNGIKYEKHKAFKIGKYWHQVDLFIEPNVIVEIDGVHWHIRECDVKRDLYQTQVFTLMGYHIIRIRDKDILKNTQNCAERVIQLINELTYGVRLV